MQKKRKSNRIERTTRAKKSIQQYRIFYEKKTKEQKSAHIHHNMYLY